MSKHAPNVEQALAEIENAERHGSAEHARAAQKRLDAAGHKRAAAAKDVEEGEREARSAPPKGRSARPTTTA